MSSIKCARCTLVNFAGAETCKRCGESLSNPPRHNNQSLNSSAPIMSAPSYSPSPAFMPQAPFMAMPSVGLIQSTPDNKQSPNSTKMMLGLSGAALLIFGAFAPIVSAPIIGSINYFRNGQGDGVIILVLAVFALLFTGARYHRVVGVIGIINLLLIGYGFFTIQSRIANLKAASFSELSRNMAEAVNMEWGWAVLGIGCLLLIISSELPGESVRR